MAAPNLYNPDWEPFNLPPGWNDVQSNAAAEYGDSDSDSDMSDASADQNNVQTFTATEEFDVPTDEYQSIYTSESSIRTLDSDDLSEWGDEAPDETVIPFMDLLPELRMHVYRHVLVREKPIVPMELCPSKSIKISNSFSLLKDPQIWDRRRQPPLLRSNSVVRSEALPLYYRENVFLVTGTICSAGCMYPIYRFPTIRSANPLRMLRSLRMVLTVIQRVEKKHELSERLTISFSVDVTLARQCTDINLQVVHGRAEKKQGRKGDRFQFAKETIRPGYKEWLESAVKERMGKADEEGSYDGFSLLKAAAMMPVKLKCDQEPPWPKFKVNPRPPLTGPVTDEEYLNAVRMTLAPPP